MALEELVEVAKRRTIGFFIAVVGLAYLLSVTSNSVWVNVPIALLSISLLRFLTFDLEVRMRSSTPQAPPHLHHLHRHHIPIKDHLPNSSGVTSRRIKKIDSPAVEAAIDEFTRCLVNELVVDLWYSSITSDQEAPNELRIFINELIGEIAQRAKRVNLINLLTRDMVDLVRNHLMLYRKVQAQIGVHVLDTCSSEERDKKLKKVLASSRKLHPAVGSPEAETQFLERLTAGLLAVVLRPQDAQSKLLRCFARELLACSVLRPVMNFASPGFINDLIEQSALKSKQSSKNKKRSRSGLIDSSSSRGPPELHISAKDDNLSGLEMMEVPSVALETALSTEDLENMEFKSSLAALEPREGALKDSNFANLEAGFIGEHETSFNNEAFGEGIPGLRKQFSDDHASIVQSLSEGDWAHLLDAVSQRKTQALAPEHLDNLWAKGRNYKKKEITKNFPKAAEPETLLIARQKRPALKPLHPKSNEHLKESAGKGTISSASPIEGRTRRSGSENLSNFRKLEKIDTDSIKDNREKVLNDSLMDLQEESSKETVTEDSQTSDLHRAFETQVSDLDRLIEPYTGHHPLESYADPQSSDLSVRDLKTASQHRRSKSSDSGLDDWRHSGKQTKGFRGQHLEEVVQSQGQVASNGSIASSTLAGSKHDASSTIDVPFTGKLQCQVIGAHYEKQNSKAFAVYSIVVTDFEGRSWIAQRRYRNFEQLHRRLKDMRNYSLTLPPKRFLSSNLENAFVRERCILLNKYLKDLLSIPSIAEMHEVWDFLSPSSKKYAFGNSSSTIKTLAVNVDDAVDDMSHQKGVSEDLQGAIKTTTDGIHEPARGTKRYPLDPGSDEEENKSVGRRLKVAYFPQASESSGWHSDSELQGERIESSTKSFPSFEAGDFSKGIYYSERGMYASIPEEFSPVNSIAGSDIIEDELAIPQEWTPPKLSVPLLNLVDTIFQLERRGWIRRQVFWIAKQILQLGMGDAIDDWILAKIQWLRREDVVASGVKLVQKVLWPDGVFIIKHYNKGTKAPSFEQKLEAARKAMVVHDIIIDHAPAPLVSLIGRKQYRRCAKDIYFFLQSDVCVKQLAYSLLEMLLIASFPELHELIVDIRSS